MRGLRITDDGDQHHGAYHGMQEVPVLVSETVKHAVSAVVRSEVPGHSVTKDKKLEPTFSADAAIHDNSEAKPNDNQTVITKAFEGIMTSTVILINLLLPCLFVPWALMIIMFVCLIDHLFHVQSLIVSK